jgi:hypothetical protein
MMSGTRYIHLFLNGKKQKNELTIAIACHQIPKKIVCLLDFDCRLLVIVVIQHRVETVSVMEYIIGLHHIVVIMQIILHFPVLKIQLIGHIDIQYVVLKIVIENL